ncbi:S8 family serine peptidase [Kamptonema sp. UHCC 0994]|uniref:S8 family serine peptidase n=1 Tax=Kamptonema sp. UHCC 0994 TaxID=3031329 RepID=UPI0023B89634|nr:S8 family serine peptidase [Kamptonema sp. UHCC 0994]MDF0555912.1 S8 family serine peptidase [Kamptonema sp. UHCC 0994]
MSAGEGNQHGAFVEGIIGATRNNGIGIDGINDIAPLWLGRAIGSGKWADSLREFVDAVKKSGQPNGLVNLSLDLTQQNPDGSVTTRYEFTPEERSALEYARQNHVLIVAAAGNDSGVMSVLGQASQEFDNIITVGAADGKNRAAYSSYGRGLDILAAGGTPEKPEWSTVGDGVGTMAGTSVATAKVTGAASLVWAANPGLNYRQVVEILKSTAMDLSAPGWDEETGAGLLDMGAAVELAKVTKPEVYNPEDFLTLTTGIRGGQVTPQERAVQVHQVQNPWGRRYYYGWLNNSNRMDRFDFTVTSTKLLQLSLKDAFNNDFLEAQVSLYDDYGNRYPVNQPDFNSSYRSVTLYPGNYQLQVDKGYRYEIDPYKLSLNFNENNNISVLDDSIWLPRPVISQPPVFTPPPSQPSVPIVIQPPPVDWQKIAEEQAKAELLKQQQAEAAAKAAAEASAKAAAEAAAKAAAEAEQRRRSEAEENARKAIALAYEQNKSWLGSSFNDVQIDWNTLLSSRVAAIQYFNGGYVVWNGVHAVAYQTGSGNSNSSTNVTPIEVRLHDLGMQYGRHEYGQYVGFANRQDYYKFTVEKIGDYYPQDLLFALRSNGVDIPLTDASIEILDDQLNPVPLSQVWQANGQPGLSHLTGATYYVRVKPAKNNLNYGLTLNLDSAQESLGSARPLGAIKGRQQFRDFVGNKGDGLGDYYSFSVENPSLLQYSLSQFDPGGDANVEILDSNGNVIPPDQFSGKVGGKELQPGQYYLRVTAANNTNTNYTLTMQMAEELGTYTGRHEYNDRVIAGKYREAFYRLKVDAPAEELHLALRNLSGDANVELLRNDGSGIVNSTLISPVVGSNQSGTQAEYKAYANVPPGDYLVRVYMPDSSVPWTKYDLVMNLDQAGEDWSRARNLGMLTDIAQSSDYQFSDFVGADRGDGSDVYKFQVGDYGLVHLALKPQAGDGEANMLAGNMRLQDESGKDVDLLNVNPDKDVNYAAAYLQPGKSYYLTVSSNREMMTNYNLVINPDQGGNDWASARDLGVIKDGQPNKADNDEDYKLQEFVGYLNGNVDGADFYKFTLDERNVMTFGLGGLSAPTHIQLFNAANPGKSIDFSQLVYETPNLDKRLKVELNKGTYYLKLSPDESFGKQGTTYSLGINAEKVILPTLTGDRNYLNELKTWNDSKWNWAAGDNTRITGPVWSGETDRRNYADHKYILQVYNDLSKQLLGAVYPSSAGYVQDDSYYMGNDSLNHTGIDIDTPDYAVDVKTLVGGTISRIQTYHEGTKEIDQFLEVAGDDGRFYRYGHLGTVNVTSGRVESGQVIGQIGPVSKFKYSNHLHFQVNETQQKPSDYNQKDPASVYEWTINPLKAFWELKRSIKTDGNNYNPVEILPVQPDIPVEDPIDNVDGDLILDDSDYEESLPIGQLIANEVVELAKESLKGLNQAITDGIRSQFNDITNPLQNKVDEAEREVAKLKSQLESLVPGPIEGLVDDVFAPVQEALRIANKLLQSAKEELKKATDVVEEVIDYAIDAAADQLNEWTPYVANIVQALFYAGEEWVENLTDPEFWTNQELWEKFAEFFVGLVITALISFVAGVIAGAIGTLISFAGAGLTIPAGVASAAAIFATIMGVVIGAYMSRDELMAIYESTKTTLENLHEGAKSSTTNEELEAVGERFSREYTDAFGKLITLVANIGVGAWTGGLGSKAGSSIAKNIKTGKYKITVPRLISKGQLTYEQGAAPKPKEVNLAKKYYIEKLGLNVKFLKEAPQAQVKNIPTPDTLIQGMGNVEFYQPAPKTILNTIRRTAIGKGKQAPTVHIDFPNGSDLSLKEIESIPELVFKNSTKVERIKITVNSEKLIIDKSRPKI